MQVWSWQRCIVEQTAALDFLNEFLLVNPGFTRLFEPEHMVAVSGSAAGFLGPVGATVLSFWLSRGRLTVG